MDIPKVAPSDDLLAFPADRLVFGVRHSPNFLIMDKIGEIVETILRAPNSPFNGDRFPLFHSSEFQHQLSNLDPSDPERITLTTQDAVADLILPTRNARTILQMAADFDSYVLDALRENLTLTGVARYGFVVQAFQCQRSIKRMPSAHYLGTDVENVGTFALRFTRRLPAEEAIVKRGVTDYRQVNYTATQDDDGNLNLSLDYQNYFDPALDRKDMDTRSFTKFAQQAVDFVVRDFARWIGNIEGRAQVA